MHKQNKAFRIKSSLIERGLKNKCSIKKHFTSNVSWMADCPTW
jgi:hypothetical protein